MFVPTGGAGDGRQSRLLPAQHVGGGPDALARESAGGGSAGEMFW